MITRRSWLKQMGGAATLSLLDVAGRAQTPPATDAVMQLGWIWNVEYAGEFMALENNYYRAGGLNLDVRPGGPQVDEIVTIMSHKALVCVSDVMTSSQAANHGAKVKIIGSTFQKAPFAITSLPGKPIRTPHDLIGKTIGVPSKQLWALKFLCLANKINSADLTIVPVGYDPAPLVNLQVDGCLTFVTNEPVQLAHQGVETVSMLFVDFGLAEFSDCLVVREDALNDPAQRSVIKAIVSGTIRGWQDAVNQPEVAAKKLVVRFGGQYGLNESVQLKTLQAQIPLIVTPESKKNGLLSMSEEDIAANIATLGRVGVPVSRDLFDTTLIGEVMAGHLPG